MTLEDDMRSIGPGVVEAANKIPAHQQQQEYIITEAVFNHVVAALRDNRQYDVAEYLIAGSRHHTPAPAHKKRIQSIQRNTEGNLTMTFDYEQLTAHDAAIVRQAREDVQPFIDLVILMETKQKEMNEIMRKHNLKIDNIDDPMQKLAFTFYAEIAEMAHKAEVVIKEYEESTQHQAGEP